MTDITKPECLYGWTDPNASPTTLYTDSVTLTIGMPLYDNTGTDTGSTVDIINQDGTFDVNSGPLYYCYSFYYGTLTPYLYLPKKPTSSGTYTIYVSSGGMMTQATKSSDLTGSYSTELTSVTDSSFIFLSDTYNYYPEGDLYT